jgi:hypothetical protein
VGVKWKNRENPQGKNCSKKERQSMSGCVPSRRARKRKSAGSTPAAKSLPALWCWRKLDQLLYRVEDRKLFDLSPVAPPGTVVEGSQSIELLEKVGEAVEAGIRIA